MSFHTEEASSPGETEDLVRTALRGGIRTIAVIGGDGTLSAAAQGFFEKLDTASSGEVPVPICSEASLAIIPAGTGNDFARGLTSGRAPVEMWLQKLIAHCQKMELEKTTTPIDLMCVTVNGGARRFICLNAVTLGISAVVAGQVSKQASALQRLPGEARFAIAALKALGTWRNHAVRLVVDKRSTTCATNMIVISNGPYIGGGMNVMPIARPDDGRLEVITTNAVSRMEALREFMRIRHGGHLANPKIIQLSGAQVIVETPDATDALPVEADGDVRGFTPLALNILPSSLRLVW